MGKYEKSQVELVAETLGMAVESANKFLNTDINDVVNLCRSIIDEEDGNHRRNDPQYNPDRKKKAKEMYDLFNMYLEQSEKNLTATADFGDIVLGSVQSILNTDPEKADVISAWGYCLNNKHELANDTVCGCFGCVIVFKPQEIIEWLPNFVDGETAVCPYCGVDSVIGESSGFPITNIFLQRMHNHWF
jgi:hypothetical protein